MTRRMWAILIGVFFVFSLLAIAWAAEISKDERWYGIYYKGKKSGRGHATYEEWKEEGAVYRKVKGNSFFHASGTAGVYGAKGSWEKKWTFNGKGKHEALLKDGVVVSIKSRYTGTRAPILRAKSKLEGNVLVIERTEGVVDKTLRIKPGDYEVTTDPAQYEPFLAEITQGEVKAKVFHLRAAEIKETTITYLGEDKARDVDGVEKPARKYKLVDEDNEVIVKTIEGRIVYHKSKDLDYDTVLVWYWTSKKKAKSDTGY